MAGMRQRVTAVQELEVIANRIRINVVKMIALLRRGPRRRGSVPLAEILADRLSAETATLR